MAMILDSHATQDLASEKQTSGKEGKAILATLQEVWEKILRRDDIGLHDDFFELGGDSIMSIQVASFAAQRGLMLSSNLIYRNPTLASLVKALEADPVPVREESEVTWDLTPIQAWFFDQQFQDMHHWNLAIALKTREDLDPEAVLLALEDVVQAHPALRSRFFRDANGRWKQGLTDAMPESDLLELFDVTRAEPERVESLCTNGINILHQKFNLEEGTLIRAGLFLLPHSGQRLALVAHHLVVDAVSWRVILEDFEQAYRKRMSGEESGIRATSSPPSSYPKHIATIRDLQEPASGKSPVETQIQRPNIALGTRIRLRKSLTEATTAKILQQASGLKAGLDEILIALVRTTLRDTPFESTPMARETHGRALEFIDEKQNREFSRTVGWFTSLEPILPFPIAGSLHKMIMDAKNATRRAINPLGPNPSALAQLAAGVVINYLGDLDATLRHSELFGELEVDPGESMSLKAGYAHYLELNAWLAGSCLHLELCHDSGKVAADQGASILARLSAELEIITDLPKAYSSKAWVPSDFPSTGLAPECLNELEPFLGDAETILPCSGMQSIMLLDTERTQGSGMFTIQVAFDLVGDLDIDAFQNSFLELYRRHQALRCSYHWNGLLRPVQIVHANAVPKIRLLSLVNDEPMQRNRKIEILLDRDYTEEFQLEQAPLIRLYLIRISTDRVKIIWTSHHLPTDGWSFPILIRDLFRFYRLRLGEVLTPPPPAGKYEDFLAWLSRKSLPESLDFWENYLAGYSCHKQIANEPNSHATARRDLHELESDLAQAVSRYRVTPSTILFAGWALAVANRENIRDIVLGMVFANRPPELAHIGETVGMFINAVPVRIRLQSDCTDAGILQELHSQLGQIQEHGYVTNSEIRGRLGLARNEALYDSIVNILNYPESEMDGADLGHLLVENRFYRERNSTPLTLQLYLKPTLRAEIRFDPTRFTMNEVEASLDAFAIEIGRMANCDIQNSHRQILESV